MREINWELIICLVLYFAIGYKIIWKAVRNIAHGEIFDENFLMVVASLGSIFTGEASEAVMVILLYRIGEFFQGKAVAKSRRSISDLMDIRPDFANIEKDGDLIQVDPEDVEIGAVITVKPGERVPLDGEVISGASRLDTAALTGEAAPRAIKEGDEIYSGSINLDGLIKVRVTKSCEESTASRILELVEESAENRGKAEAFITRFAHWYTPIVCGLALLTFVAGGLVTGDWAGWGHRALVFLVISCPCALVISVPLSFFAGIGGASSKGILIKGGNYLEALAKADTVVFDKTGTLTKGVFSVVAIHPEMLSEERLLELTAYAESFSDHPISRSLAEAYGKKIDKSRVSNANEFAGYGITSTVDDLEVSCGNRKFMKKLNKPYHDCEIFGTAVHVVVAGQYVGHIIITDQIKDDAKQAVEQLRRSGIKRLAMLTGDKEEVAAAVAGELKLDEYHSQMLPEDKMNLTKGLMEGCGEGKKLAFVGDGINDAPVLTAADVGIAMGGMGSAAAVEAADIVLMNDRPSDVALAVRVARKTMSIIYQNIAFSLGIKVVVLIASVLGYDKMWLAVFADVGVCLLAIINSMRALRIK